MPRNEEATARFEKLAVLAKLVPNRITPSTITQASTTAAAERWMSDTTVPDVVGAAVVSSGPSSGDASGAGGHRRRSRWRYTAATMINAWTMRASASERS